MNKLITCLLALTFSTSIYCAANETENSIAIKAELEDFIGLSNTGDGSPEQLLEAGLDKSGTIEVNGIRKSLLSHIVQSRAARRAFEDIPLTERGLWREGKTQFSLSPIFRLCEGKMVDVGLASIPSRQSLIDITDNNFVYAPCYQILKHPLTGAYHKVGAIIVGTTDQELALQISAGTIKRLVS